MTMTRSALARSKSGFTLVEMLVATVLASVVLLGLFNLVTNMVQSQVKNTRSGTVSAWAVTALTGMTNDIAGASMLSYPAVGSSSDYLIVCSNWSTKMNTTGGAVLNGGAPSSQQYCYDTTDAAPNGNTILRRTTNTCPTAPVTPCTVANYGGTNAVVATGVYRNGGNPIFFSDNKTLNGVRIRLTIGNPTANAASAGSGGAVMASPVSIPYDTEIILED